LVFPVDHFQDLAFTPLDLVPTYIQSAALKFFSVARAEIQDADSTCYKERKALAKWLRMVLTILRNSGLIPDQNSGISLHRQLVERMCRIFLLF
jgi:hypothetical protein